MSLQDEHFPRQVEDKASVWAARMEEGLEPAERAALDSWLSEDESHRRCLAQYRSFSADLDDRLPALVGAGLIAMPDPAPATRPAWPRPGAMAAIAAAAAACVAVAAWAAFRAHPINVHATERQSLNLADGSHAYLNAHTDLVVELSATSRRVRLANGEAMFSVVHDEKRPFIVQTPGGTVRDVGTVFNIRADPSGKLEVTVLKGAVSVVPAGTARAESGPVSLIAGQQFSSNVGTRQVKSLPATAVADVVAWRQGGVVFEGTPLRAALTRVGNFNDLPITIAPEVANLRLGGRFRMEDMDGFLTALEAALPVRVTREPDGSVRVDARAPTRN